MGRPPKPRLTTTYPPRGMRAEQAATYLGMSEVSFLRLVAEGTFPAGIPIKGMKVWDRCDLDRVFDNLKAQREMRNTFDALLDTEDG